MKRVVVLLSGGQDSTTSLFWAKREWPNAEIHALTMFYGQRHASEIEAAEAIAKLAGCKSHKLVTVPVLDSADSALVNDQLPLKADGGFVDDAMPQGLPTSFVPGRNLVFLALAAAHAGAVKADAIVTGVCQTDYSGYPDCRQEFINAMEDVIAQAWPTGLPAPGIFTPLMNLTKAQTVELMRDIALVGAAGMLEHVRSTDAWKALGLTVTCYNGLRPGCNECAACDLRRKGFAEAGVADPAGMRL